MMQTDQRRTQQPVAVPMEAWLQMAQKDDEEEKPPKGFEKFFKNKKGAQKTEEDKEEKESPKKEPEESDGEEEEKEKEQQTQEDNRNAFVKFFLDPDNNPKPEGLIGVLLAAATGYYLFSYKKPMKEIVYMEFLNDYLLKNQVKEINITKDRRSEVFNFRAEITTHDGEQCYMILKSYESFLAKLDFVQREMGKQANEYIPVKYKNSNDENFNANVMNFLFESLEWIQRFVLICPILAYCNHAQTPIA